jgi:hypothetical protein
MREEITRLNKNFGKSRAINWILGLVLLIFSALLLTRKIPSVDLFLDTVSIERSSEPKEEGGRELAAFLREVKPVWELFDLDGVDDPSEKRRAGLRDEGIL